jgi:hypothetical protein
MKVLYIPTKCPHDFQRETINWGLRSLNISNEITFEKTFNNVRLYSSYTEPVHHYTYYKKWQEKPCEINLSDINDKIKNKYYDIVILQDGFFPGIYDEQQLINLYNIYNKNLYLIDGEDGSDGSYMTLLKKYPRIKYFRRELLYMAKYSHNNLFPVNFGFPDELIPVTKAEKTKDISSIIPGDGSTYIYNEEKYYQEYQTSKLAYTFSKGGWDCLRHLEIVFNDSLPIFLDIEHCPHYTLYYYPKFLLTEVLQKIVKIDYYNYEYDQISSYGKNNYWKNIINKNLIKVKNLDEYEELKNKVFDHCKKYLTCRNIVKRILEHYE